MKRERESMLSRMSFIHFPLRSSERNVFGLDERFVKDLCIVNIWDFLFSNTAAAAAACFPFFFIFAVNIYPKRPAAIENRRRLSGRAWKKYIYIHPWIVSLERWPNISTLTCRHFFRSCTKMRRVWPLLAWPKCAIHSKLANLFIQTTMNIDPIE